jgi:hypothetical protein
MRSPLSMIFVVALLTMTAMTTSFSAPSETLYLQKPDGCAIRGLIIGIDAYEHLRRLKGSVADARDIDRSIRSMGTCDVTTLIEWKPNACRLSFSGVGPNRIEHLDRAIAGNVK